MGKDDAIFSKLVDQAFDRKVRLNLFQRDDFTWTAGAYMDEGRRYEWAAGPTVYDALERLMGLLPPVGTTWTNLGVPVRPAKIAAQAAEDDFADLA